MTVPYTQEFFSQQLAAVYVSVVNHYSFAKCKYAEVSLQYTHGIAASFVSWDGLHLLLRVFTLPLKDSIAALSVQQN